VKKPIDIARKGLKRLGRAEAGARLAQAPGRVNLIGEHTDYNDGFVLPLAIDRHAAVAYADRDDGVLRAYSVEFDEIREAEVRELEPGGQTGWFAYVAGVAWVLRDSPGGPSGADLAIAGDVPIGAGLASSAALEMAVARALGDLMGIPWYPARVAALGRRAENMFVGVECGIMDQFVAATSREGHATLLDCRTLDFETVPIPQDVAVIVMDTRVRRRLAAGEYNRRRASCAEAMKAVARICSSARALRDVDEGTLESAEHLMDPVTYRRAKHVVGEMRRPLQMAAALRSGDLQLAGDLMRDSHVSLRDLFEVSCAELDAMVESAMDQPGCIGARMTGAGFGGCAIALVHADRTEPFLAGVTARYEELTGRRAAAFLAQPAAGASLLDR